MTRSFVFSVLDYFDNFYNKINLVNGGKHYFLAILVLAKIQNFTYKFLELKAFRLDLKLSQIWICKLLHNRLK